MKFRNFQETQLDFNQIPLHLLVCCGLSYPIVLPASAQEEQEEPIVLDPIVVSGGKEKVLSDTPQSVSVLNQDELDRKQPTTVGDALTDLPGVKSSGSDRVLGEAFNIRGFGQDNSGGEGRLILQVDGAKKYYQQYRMGGLFTDPELYKRVEVLRGPASSTLHGSGALAGVVTLETKDASDFLKDDDQFALRQKLEMTSNGYGGLTAPFWLRVRLKTWSFWVHLSTATTTTSRTEAGNRSVAQPLTSLRYW